MKTLVLALLVAVPMSASAGVMEDMAEQGAKDFSQLSVAPAVIQTAGAASARAAASDPSEDALYSMAQSIREMNAKLSQTLTGEENIAVIVPLMSQDSEERAELASDVQDFSKSVDAASVQSQSMTVALRRVVAGSDSMGARAVFNSALDARSTVEGMRTHSAALEAAIEAQGQTLSYSTVQLAKDLVSKTDVLAGVMDALIKNAAGAAN